MQEEKTFDLPRIFSSFSNLTAAQSTRLGGGSTGKYNTQNLGLNTGDKADFISKNRSSFFKKLGFSETKIAHSFQIHGDQILHVTKPIFKHGYDALITNSPNVLLSVTIADCVPILVYDKKNKAVAAIHAGWKGTIKHITSKTIRSMAENFGTMTKDCVVFIGTSICKTTFEVDQDVAQHFGDPYKHWDIERNKFLIDLRQHNYDQLIDLGVTPKSIEVSTKSTVLDNQEYYSYRKEGGQTGRMLAVIGMK